MPTVPNPGGGGDRGRTDPTILGGPGQASPASPGLAIIRREQRLLVLQPAQVAAGAKGYQTSGQIGSRATMTGALVMSDLANGDPLIYLRFGVTGSTINSESDRAGALSACMTAGQTSQPDVRDAIPILNPVFITPQFDFEIADPNSCLYIAIDNRSATNAVNITVVFSLILLPDID